MEGQVTLDVCNADYPSEQLRTNRLQVVARNDQGDTALSTEAVAYRSGDATAQAFTELKAAAANCPAGPVTSPVGEPTSTTHFNAAPDANWLATATVDRLAFDMVTTDDGGDTNHSLAVYLRRGRVLLGLYFHSPDEPLTVGGKNDIPGIVGLFAGRMAALPASVVG